MVVLLNCGGTEDVRLLLGMKTRPPGLSRPCALWAQHPSCPLLASRLAVNPRPRASDLASAPRTRCLVVDSHRPLHLANCAASNTDVIVLRDTGEHAPGREDGQELFPGVEDGEEEDGGDAGDDDAGNNGGEENAEARNVRPRIDDAAAQQKARACSALPLLCVYGARGRLDGQGDRHLSNTNEPTRPPMQAAAQFQYYARGAFWGTPCAVTLYDVAHCCRRDALHDGLPLWMAVVGLTDAYLHSKMSAAVYTSSVARLAQRVGDGQAPGTSRGDVAAIFARRRLAYLHDTRFFLLRHWSPYDAIAYAPHCAARLRTWSEGGRKVLDRLFAELGVPLAEAKAPYVHMSPGAKAALLGDRLADVAASYGLDGDSDLRFWTFHRSGGPGLHDVSASDVALGVTALLEGGDAVAAAERSGEGGDGGGGGGGGEGGGEGGLSPQAGFASALAALSDANVGVLRRGIAAAQRLQAAVVRCGGGAIAHDKVANAGAFRVLNMATGLHGTPGSSAASARATACSVAAAAVCASSGQDVALVLAHPQALLRLGLFIQEALYAQRRARKPLVLAAPALTAQQQQQDGGPQDQVWCHVIGVTAPVPTSSDAAGNRFSLAFRAAATACGAPFVHDAFDAACIAVAAHKLGPFLEAVQSELDQLAAAQAAL